MGADGDHMIHFTMLKMNIGWKKCEAYGSGPFMLQQCTPPTKPFAAQCTLFPKIQTFNASVVNGVLHERLVAEEPVPKVAYPDYQENLAVTLLPWTKIANRTLRSGQWQNCTPSTESSTNTSLRVLPDRLIAFDNEGDEAVKWYPQECIWAIDDSTNGALQQFLLNMFNTSELTLRWTDSGIGFSGDPWVLNLYNNGTANISGVTRYFRGLEDAMPSYIMQTCIAVEWGWMSFPAVLTLVGAIFLGESGMGSWKSLTLAGLFSRLDEDVRGRYGKLDKKSEIQEGVSELKVRLVLTDGGWRLKEEKKWEEEDEGDVGQ